MAHDLGLAGVLGEAHDRDAVVGGEAGHRRPERVADLGEAGRRGNRMAQVLGQERDHLPADLQVRDVGVQIDAVQALQVEGHMAVEEVVDVARCGHGTTSA
jgi:hypothetical protein